MTRNRRPWLPFALRQTQYQTYKNREILVIADGEDVRDLIPDKVRYVYSPDFGTIGAKRNVGCSHARGEIIAHFDDDDFSSPSRIAFQVEQIMSSGGQAAGFHTLRFTDGERWWQYHLRPQYVLGTTLCYRKSFWEQNKFPEIQVNEDGEFVNKAQPVLVSADAGDLMFATIHDQNTSPRNLSTAQWTAL